MTESSDPSSASASLLPPEALVPPQYQKLGFSINPGTINDYVEVAQRAIDADARVTVLYHNLHSLYSYFTSEQLREDYAGHTVLVDGRPVIWILRATGLRQLSFAHRVAYIDFITPLLTRSRDQRWTVFHLGQAADVQQAAMQSLRARIPGLDIRGHDGYFDQSPNSPDSLRIVEEINESGAKLLLVGFGAPLQERWLAAHRHLLNVPVVYTCGALMEFEAGVVRTPPRWLGRFGLEWTARFFDNPRRFAFRYLVEPVVLAWILLRNAMSGRQALDNPERHPQ